MEVLDDSVTTVMAAGCAWCFLCGKRVGLSGRSSTNIFLTQTLNGQKPLSHCIAAILQVPLLEEDIPSQLICKACHKSVGTIDELEMELTELRDELVTRHRKTTRLLQAGELPPSDNTEDKVARKTKLVTRTEVMAEEIVVETGEEGEITEPRKRRGRPPSRKKHVEEAEDPVLRGLVEIHGELEETTEVVSKVEAGDMGGVELEDEEPDEEIDEDGIGHDSDPEFVPLEDEDPEFVPVKKMQGRRSAARHSNVERGTPKLRGRKSKHVIKNDSADDADDIQTFIEEDEDAEAAADDPDAVFTCSSCDARFSVVGALITHLRRKHGITVLMCDLCGVDFETQHELSTHVATEHPPDDLEDEEAEEMRNDFDPELDAEGDFQCEICNRLFYSMRALREHKRTHYGRNYMCEVCHKRFASRQLLEEHQNCHTGQRPYECHVCHKTFASKYCLRVHIKIHEVRPRPHACDMCGKSFMKPEHLSQHKRTHIAQKDFVCGTCGKGFSSSRNLEVHAVVHTGYKPFVCRTCGKAFARRAEILDHERIHTGERPFQCETCGATFSQRSNLQSHKRATHMDDRRFVCQACGKSFKRRRLLDYHTRSVHTGERPYACSECNATFVYPEHFKKHRRIHTGEKPFRCEVCNKAFNSRDNRNAHRFIHSNKKPYECLVCGLGFMRKPLLYSHMQSQGHVEDTIVVNQPQVPSVSNVVSEAAAAAGISGDKVYVHTQEDPEPQHVEEVEHILIEGPVHFETTDGEGGDDERTHAILVPVSSGERGKDGGNVQLVQIRLQGSGDQQWINLSTS